MRERESGGERTCVSKCRLREGCLGPGLGQRNQPKDSDRVGTEKV